MHRFILAFISIFLTTQARATKEEFVTINIVFEDSLKAPAKDKATFQKWSDQTGSKTLSITDEDMKNGKDALLAKIAQFVKDNPNVNINYSGHGEDYEATPGEYGLYFSEDGFACKPENAKYGCQRKTIKKPVLGYQFIGGPLMSCVTKCDDDADSDPEREKGHACEKAACSKWNAEESACYEPYYACMKKWTASGKSEDDAQALCRSFDRVCKDKEKKSPEKKICADAGVSCFVAFHKNHETCGKSCYDKYALKASDLSSILAGKKVFGVFDACHSQGFAEELNVKDKYFLTSAARDEVSVDGKIGGLLANEMDRKLTEETCYFEIHNQIISAADFLRQNIEFPKMKDEKAPDGRPWSRWTQTVSSGSAIDKISYLKNIGMNCGSTGALSKPSKGDSNGAR